MPTVRIKIHDVKDLLLQSGWPAVEGRLATSEECWVEACKIHNLMAKHGMEIINLAAECGNFDKFTVEVMPQQYAIGICSAAVIWIILGRKAYTIEP